MTEADYRWTLKKQGDSISLQPNTIRQRGHWQLQLSFHPIGVTAQDAEFSYPNSYDAYSVAMMYVKRV